MADAVDAFYQGSVAQFKKTEKKPKKKGNAITKGLKYGALAGAGLGAISGVRAINSALRDGQLSAGPSPNAYRAIGGSFGGIKGAAQLGSLGALGGLGVYGVNRLRAKGEKKEPRGLRGRVNRLRGRFA